MSAAGWQLVLVDALFLCLAAGMGLWFRAWLRREKAEMDQRLGALEGQWARLERVCSRLQAVCRTLELLGRDEPGGMAESRKIQGKDTYSRAWEMLGRGMPAAEVARALGMGVAEVELMGRMLRFRRQG